MTTENLLVQDALGNLHKDDYRIPASIMPEQTPIPVRETLTSILATVTRPANEDPYAASDVIGTAVTGLLTFASALRTAGNSGKIVKVKVLTNQSTNVAQFRLHLFSAAPTAIADNAPGTILYADESKHLGYIDVAAAATEGTGSDASVGQWTGTFPLESAAGVTTLYGVLVTKSIFTPASGQKFSVRLHVSQN